MPARRTVKYSTARDFVKTLQLSSRVAWRQYAKAYADILAEKGIPTRPDVRYLTEGWKSWHVWLGVVQVRTQEVMPRDQFVALLRRPKVRKALGSKAKYQAWCKAHPEERKRRKLPSSPANAYANFTWRDVFERRAMSAGNVVRTYGPFVDVRREVRREVRAQKMTKVSNWKDFVKAHPEWLDAHQCPAAPNAVAQYASRWCGWADFLGFDQRPTCPFKR